MATRFRINSLSTENQGAVNRAAEVSGMGKNAFLDYVEKNGKLPPYVEGQELQLGDKVVNQVNSELGKYNQTEDFKKQTNPNVDESKLTQDELQSRLEAFQGTDKQTTQGEFQPLTLRSKFLDRFGSSPATSKIADRLTEFFKSNNRLPNPNSAELAGIFGSDPSLRDQYQKLYPIFQNEVQSGLYNTQTTQNNTQDISRLQTQIDAMKAQGASQAEIDAYLNSLPDELSKSREDFLKGESDRAINQFTQFVPKVQQSENARGMLFSGNVADELSTKALNVESLLENQRIQAEADDNQFYYDAAYRDTVRKALSASTDLQASLDSERNRVLTDRSNRFKSSQATLDSALNEQLAKDDATRNLNLRKSQLQSEADAKAKESNLNALSAVTSAAGGVAGAAVGGPAGAAVGSQVGSGVAKI